MGTNFFLHEQKPKQCPTCGHTPNYEPLHIGKSSMGWCFSLHVMPEEGLNTLEDWTMRWSKPGTIIKNEYGEQLTPFEMHDYITNRKGRANAWSASDLARNHAVQGPNHLARHNGENCAGHGPGTYDYITGWFR